MNTIRTFVRHVLEEHSVVNRLIMHEGDLLGPNPDWDMVRDPTSKTIMPAGLEQSLSGPASAAQLVDNALLQVDQDLQRKSAIASVILTNNKEEIIKNVDDMFERLASPGMDITEEDQLIRAIAILKLLHDDSKLYAADPELEFPYTTALFVIGWDNEKQSPEDTLTQIAYNVSAAEESILNGANKRQDNPRARGSQQDQIVIDVPAADYSSVKNAALAAGGTLAVIFGAYPALKILYPVLKHAGAEQIIKKGVKTVSNIATPEFIRSATSEALTFIADKTNAEKFKLVYKSAITSSTGNSFVVWFKSWFPELRDFQISRINELLRKRENITKVISQIGKDLLASPEAKLTRIRRQIAGADDEPVLVADITNLDSIVDVKGADKRLQQIINFYNAELVKIYEGDIVVSLIQDAARDTAFAQKSEAEMKEYFINEIRTGFSSKIVSVTEGRIDEVKSFADLLSSTTRDEKKSGQGIIVYILGGEKQAAAFDFSNSAKSSFMNIEKELNTYVDSLASITAVLFGSMVRSSPTWLSGRGLYTAGTIFGYASYAFYTCAAAYFGLEIIGTDSERTYVSAEDAKILLQDAHIRSSAKDAMNNIQSGGWFNTNAIVDKKLPLGDADAALAAIFSTPVGDSVDISLINNAMILYRKAIMQYREDYLEGVDDQGFGNIIDDVDRDIQALVDKRKSKAARKPAAKK